MTKKIQVGHDHFALVDDCDYERVSSFKWYYYAPKRGGTYATNGKKQKMHRFIMDCAKDKQIDHVDGNGLNNTRANLRVCTPSENQMNRGKQKNNTTGFKGVYFDKRKNRFTAEIRSNGERVRLGRFRTAEEASTAYRNAAIKYHGEFAKVN